MKARTVDLAIDAGAFELPGIPKCATAKAVRAFIIEIRSRGGLLEKLVFGWALRYVEDYIERNCHASF